MLVSFALSFWAKLVDVKKLSVVMFLPLFKYGDMSCITTLSSSDSLAEHSSSFPQVWDGVTQILGVIIY